MKYPVKLIAQNYTAAEKPFLIIKEPFAVQLIYPEVPCSMIICLWSIYRKNCLNVRNYHFYGNQVKSFISNEIISDSLRSKT